MSFEVKESRERFGKNVEVSFLFMRHAEKSSGSVGSGSEVSVSGISARGVERTKELGSKLAEISEPLSKVKIRHSNMIRTLQTAQVFDQAYTSQLVDKNAYTPRINESLNVKSPEDFTSLYISKWEQEKLDFMLSHGYLDESFLQFPAEVQIRAASRVFGMLSSQDQANIAEEAEKSVVEAWTDDPSSGLSRLFPLEAAAAQVATLLQRDLRLVRRLKSGSKQNFLCVTHKTVTEPLLMKIAILKDGSRPVKIKDIGGPLGLNDAWEVHVDTDSEGRPSMTLDMYRTDRNSPEAAYRVQSFGIDNGELARLAE